MNREIYATITNRFIEKLKQGIVPVAKALARRSEHQFPGSRIRVSMLCFSALRTSNRPSG